MTRTLRTPRALLGAYALTLALCPLAGAQFSQPDNASRSLKNQSQLEVQETHVNLKNPKNVLGLTLQGFKTNVAKGNFGPDDEELPEGLVDLFADMEAVQADMAFAVQESVRDLRNYGNSLLLDLETAGQASLGDYPENFYRGVNGTLDVFAYNMGEITRKSQRLMRHRLRALAKNLRKNSDILATSVVGPDVPLPSLVLSSESVQPEEHLLSVDLLMAFSNRDLSNDGVLCVSGTAMQDKGPVTVQVYDPAGALVDENVLPNEGGPTGNVTEQDRWSTTFSELPEGNYTVIVNQDLNKATNEIGIR